MVVCVRGLIGGRFDWLPALQITDPLTNQPTRSPEAMLNAIAQSEAAGLARVITGAATSAGAPPSQKVVLFSVLRRIICLASSCQSIRLPLSRIFCF